MTLDELLDRIESMGGPGMDRVMRSTLEDAGLRGVSTAKRHLRTTGRQRTGNLWNSVRHEVRRSASGGAEMALQAGGALQGGLPVRYARIQEEGGIVRPVRSRMLAIPIGPGALTPLGVSRYSSPRDYPGGLTLIKDEDGGRDGNGVVLLIDDAGAAQYVLKASVKIKGRRYLRAGMGAARKYVKKGLIEHARKVITGGSGGS